MKVIFLYALIATCVFTLTVPSNHLETDFIPPAEYGSTTTSKPTTPTTPSPTKPNPTKPSNTTKPLHGDEVGPAVHHNGSTTAPSQPTPPPTAPAPSLPLGASIPALPFPVQCQNGMKLNPKTLDCECPKDKPMKNALGVCEACKAPKVWDPKVKKCTCQGDLQMAANGTCVKCAPPGVWDLKNSKCMKCPDGFEFSQVTSKCHCPADKPFVNN